jgi:arylformamidase
MTFGIGGKRIIDISVPVRPGMVVYEGDPDVTLSLAASIVEGAVANVSRLACGVHTGTHIDAPYHFIDGAAGVDGTPVDALIGPAVVVDATALDRDIDVGDIDRLAIPEETERLLLRTKNSELWSRPEFSPDFIGLTAAAAGRLVELGIRLVGVDYLSVAPKGDPAPTHLRLLEAGVVILEGIDLRWVEAGRYTLVCLPLRLVGADGAPARAVLLPASGNA